MTVASLIAIFSHTGKDMIFGYSSKYGVATSKEEERTETAFPAQSIPL